jgi:hypothetical protein
VSEGKNDNKGGTESRETEGAKILRSERLRGENREVRG